MTITRPRLPCASSHDTSLGLRPLRLLRRWPLAGAPASGPHPCVCLQSLTYRRGRSTAARAEDALVSGLLSPVSCLLSLVFLEVLVPAPPICAPATFSILWCSPSVHVVCVATRDFTLLTCTTIRPAAQPALQDARGLDNPGNAAARGPDEQS